MAMARTRVLMHVLMALAVVVSGLLATGAPVLAAGCSPAQLRQIETRVFEMVNQERTSRGIAPLGRLQSIDQMAQDWSYTMYQTDNFVHRHPDEMQQMAPGNH